VEQRTSIMFKTLLTYLQHLFTIARCALVKLGEKLKNNKKTMSWQEDIYHITLAITNALDAGLITQEKAEELMEKYGIFQDEE